MNKYIQLIILVFCAFLSSACQGSMLTSRITVVDEDGDPVQGAMVRIAYYSQTPATVTGDHGEGLTDTSGMFTFRGRAYSVGAVSARKEGYYLSNKELNLRAPGRSGYHEVMSRKDITLVLREIRDPVPMYVKKRVILTVPEYGNPIGFDVEQADWVAPYGTGSRSDMLIEVDGYFQERNDREATLTVSFPHEGDGIMIVESHPHSELKSPHAAPADGYHKEVSTTYGVKPAPAGRGMYGERQIGHTLVFRVRSEVGPDGEITSAQHGKIYGGIRFDGILEGRDSSVHFPVLYFNPDRGSRSLEFDVRQNLVEFDGPEWRHPKPSAWQP